MQETMKDTEFYIKDPVTIHELTWNYVDDGILMRQQLAKEVVYNKRGWVIMAYLFRPFDKRKGKYNDPKIALARYRRRNGILKRVGTAFNMSAVQCYVACDIMKKWLEDPIATDADATEIVQDTGDADTAKAAAAEGTADASE